MHKLRNTIHIELLQKMYDRYGSVKRISKKQMRIILQSNNWNEHKVIQEIENDLWWYRFCKD